MNTLIEPDGKGGWKMKRKALPFKSLFEPIKRGDLPLVDDYFDKENKIKTLEDEIKTLREKK